MFTIGGFPTTFLFGGIKLVFVGPPLDVSYDCTTILLLILVNISKQFITIIIQIINSLGVSRGLLYVCENQVALVDSGIWIKNQNRKYGVPFRITKFVI